MLQSSTIAFLIESFHMLYVYIFVVDFSHHRTYLVDSDDEISQTLWVFMNKQCWMHTPLVHLERFHIFIGLVHMLHDSPYSLY